MKDGGNGNSLLLWKQKKKALLTFASKKKRDGCLIFSVKTMHTLFFGWKSISVRKAFLISALSATPGPDLQFMLTTLIPDTLRPNMVIHQTEGMCVCI